MPTPSDRPSAPSSRPATAAGAPSRPAPAPRRGRLAGVLGLLGAVTALHAVVLREAMALGLPVPAARPAAAATGERTHRALRVRTVAPAAPAAPAAASAEVARAAAGMADEAPAWPGTAAAAAALPTPRDEPAGPGGAAVRPGAPARSRTAPAAPAAAPLLVAEAPAAALPREPASFEILPRFDAGAVVRRSDTEADAAPSPGADAPPAADPAVPVPDARATAESATTAAAAGPEAPPAARPAEAVEAPESPLPVTGLLLAAAAADPAPDAAAHAGPRAASAPEAGARDGGPPSPAPAQVPVYRTRIPPPALLSYDLRRGPLSGTGQLDWKPEGGRYTARLESRVLGVRAMVLESRGTLDPDGIAPVRYTDERRGRSAQAANFRRTPGGEGGKITYSGPSDEVPLPRGAQDRLSWMLQLAAIGAADPARVGPGGRVSIFVSGARADADVWTFTHVASEPLSIGDRRVDAVHLVREPRGEHDTRAEVWLDPERSYLPVRARLSNGQGRDAGDALELMLRP